MRKLKNEELGRLSVGQFQNAIKIPVSIILDNVRSLHNVGSVFRTADAFRIEKIYLCGITAKPPHREIHKTALGSEDAVAWEYHKDITVLIKQLKTEQIHLIAVEQAKGSVQLQKFTPASKVRYALIFGHEVTGVSQEVMDQADTVLELPQFGTKHSLNISVSVGIVVWDIFCKLQ